MHLLSVDAHNVNQPHWASLPNGIKKPRLLGTVNLAGVLPARHERVMLKKLFITALVLLLLVGAAINYLLSDTQRVKTELGAQLTAASGYQVDIRGKLDWQVIPSLGVAVTDITLRDGETQIHIGKLRVGLSLFELTKPPEAWTLGSLIMDEVRLKDADFRVQRFALQNFELGKTAPFQAQILMLKGSEPSAVKEGSAPIELAGDMIYTLNTSQKNPDATLSDLELLATTVQTQWSGKPLNAVCSGELRELDGVAAKDDDDLLNAYAGKMDCTSSEFTINRLSWPESKISAELRNQTLTATLLAEGGNVDISKLKQTISTISVMGGKSDPTREWPDAMGYQTLNVDASIFNEQVNLQANLDNVTLAMKGTLKQDTAQIDLKGTVTIAQATGDQLIRVDSLLVDLPLPFYCKGTTGEPDCGPDTKKAMSIVGDLMKREGKRLLRDEAEKKLLEGIEDKIPDNLKESAKQLLNLFN